MTPEQQKLYNEMLSHQCQYGNKSLIEVIRHVYLGTTRSGCYDLLLMAAAAIDSSRDE